MVSDGSARSSFITYLYNALLGDVVRGGGSGELLFGDGRAAVKLCSDNFSAAREKIAEVIGVGYKYAFLSEHLRAGLNARERKLLLCALIAADYDSDRAFIKGKMGKFHEFCLDGFYRFRLAGLREKWRRIAEYVPESFSSSDLEKFCEFLVGESKHKVYLKGNVVFGENFAPLRRSRLIGEENVESELMLSDAGFVYCLGEVEAGLGDFLQKYYAERAIFS